jgi:hypothetical protein
MPASNIRYKPPVIVPKLTQRHSSLRGGFGTFADTDLSKAVPGLSIGNSVIYKTPATRAAVSGIDVQPSPGQQYTQQYIKLLPISLAATFTDVPYYISGTILWYMTSTNVTDQLSVRIGSYNADRMPWGPGNGIEGVSYSVVYISNFTGVAGATAQLVYFSDTPESPARFF